MQPTSLVLALVVLGQTAAAGTESAPAGTAILPKPDAVSTQGVVSAPEPAGTAGPSTPPRPIAPPEAAAPLQKLAPQTLPRAAGTVPLTTPPITAPGTAPATTAFEPARPKQRRATPPEMIAEALVLPPDSPLEGRPVTLLEVLARAAGSQRRLQVTHAYWRLAEAVARYHYRREESDRLDQFQSRPQDTATLRTARASAQAALRTAQLAAVAAQHELAEAARLAATDPLPLPADRPHIGPYRTRFDELFSMRVAPGRTRLIDRTLPVRRRTIDVRADAVHAAEDALEAVVDAYRTGRAEVATVLSSRRQLALQQQALVASVCQYNHDIADYAVAVAPPQISGQALVAMLITPARPATTGQPPKTISRPPSGVEPAGLTEPIRPIPQIPLRPMQRTQPTLAPPRDSPAGTGQPTPAKARELTQPPDEQTPTLAPPRDVQTPSGMDEPKLPPRKPLSASGIEQPGAAVPAWWNRPAAAAEESPPQKPTTRTVKKPNVDTQGSAGTGPTALYPALADVAPAARASQLTVALHWDRSVPKENTDSVTLEDCLGYYLGTQRREVIDAYWVARQRAAAYQIIAQQAGLLNDLVPLAVQARGRPLGAESMLSLRAVRLATDADLLRARVQLAESQFALTRRVGRPPDGNWLLPATAPHSGPYDLKLEVRQRQLVQSWPLRRAATVVPVLHQSLAEHGTAVVQADLARAAATADYQAGLRSLEAVLASVDDQTRQTLAFLQTLSDYNQAIADYALTVLPPGIPPEKLVQTLVLAD